MKCKGQIYHQIYTYMYSLGCLPGLLAEERKPKLIAKCEAFRKHPRNFCLFPFAFRKFLLSCRYTKQSKHLLLLLLCFLPAANKSRLFLTKAAQATKPSKPAQFLPVSFGEGTKKKQLHTTPSPLPRKTFVLPANSAVTTPAHTKTCGFKGCKQAFVTQIARVQNFQPKCLKKLGNTNWLSTESRNH